MPPVSSSWWFRAVHGTAWGLRARSCGDPRRLLPPQLVGLIMGRVFHDHRALENRRADTRRRFFADWTGTTAPALRCWRCWRRGSCLLPAKRRSSRLRAVVSPVCQFIRFSYAAAPRDAELNNGEPGPHPACSARHPGGESVPLHLRRQRLMCAMPHGQQFAPSERRCPRPARDHGAGRSFPPRAALAQHFSAIPRPDTAPCRIPLTLAE